MEETVSNQILPTADPNNYAEIRLSSNEIAEVTEETFRPILESLSLQFSYEYLDVFGE